METLNKTHDEMTQKLQALYDWLDQKEKEEMVALAECKEHLTDAKLAMVKLLEIV